MRSLEATSGDIYQHCADMAYRMATRTAVEDRWVVGVRWTFCVFVATTPPTATFVAPDEVLEGAAAEGSARLCSIGRLGCVKVYTST